MSSTGPVSYTVAALSDDLKTTLAFKDNAINISEQDHRRTKSDTSSIIVSALASDRAQNGSATTPNVTFPMGSLMHSKPVQTSTFLAIPQEIRDIIYSYLLPNGQDIDITIPHKKRGVQRLRFKRAVPDMKNVSILRVCEQTEREGMEFMYSSNHFRSKHPDTIKVLPRLLGEMGTSSMQYLDLHLDFMLKTHKQLIWADTLEFISQQLPSLQKFRLRTQYSAHADPYPETSGTTRFGQECRALLRFGAFVTNRHPLLKRLYWLAESGPTNELYEDRVTLSLELLAQGLRRKWNTTEKYEKQGDAAKKVFEDIMLDSTAIRRVTWNDGAMRTATEFEIARTSETSELIEVIEVYKQVHALGYLTEGAKREQGRENLPSIDKMIREAEASIRQADLPRSTNGGRGSHRGGGSGRGYRGANVANLARGRGDRRGSARGRGSGTEGDSTDRGFHRGGFHRARGGHCRGGGWNEPW